MPVRRSSAIRLWLAVVLGIFVALPAAASAATYEVDSTGDQPDAVVGTGGCLTGVATCTLRAALEESNFSTGTKDTITFSGAVFEGEAADTLTPATALPTITDPVNVFGGECTTEAGPEGPCAGVDGPSAASVLKVENANGVTIAGLAITGGTTGINVINSSEEFDARADWIGEKLDGSSGGNTTGIFLDPDSDKAKIGGPEPEERNVFANNAGDGLDVLGADEVQVLGNYFGVEPDGATVASNGKDIEVNSTSVGGFTASDDVIGKALSPAAAASAECDGGCNVISGASLTGLDLQGDGGQEAPAVATHVEGNFVGLDAAGTSVAANGTYGILVGAAKEALIGGGESGEANFIAGGGEGVYTENADALEVIGNTIGRNALGAEVTPPSAKGMFIFSLSVTEPASIENNDIRMAGGVGIEQRFEGGRIVDNSLEGGSIGIWIKVEPGGGLIAGNVVEAPGEYGILVESPDNEIRRNSVFNSGKAGIRVKNPPGIAMTGNLIGGNSAERENVIEGSGGPAIEILEEALEPGSVTEIARNRGSANKGLFIDLVSGANEGILPPTIGAAKLTGASGSGASPGATVRVFRKASAEPGEIESFLGETEADGSGNWSVTYGAAIPGETRIAATQTFEGTSELAFATTEPAPKPPGGGGNGGGKGGGGTKDTTPPETTITKGPKAKTHSRKAKFKFTSSEAGSTFECKLDRKPFKPCGSPKKYSGLKPGKHVFKVRAIDKAGNVDPTPAKKKFKVLG